MKSWGAAGVLAVGLFAVLGCGTREPDVYPVTGKVVFRDGRPVVGAIVEFVPATGPGARAKTGTDGAFELTTGTRKGAVAGAHKVAVVQLAVADGAMAHVKAHHATMVVHPKYAGFQTSGLTRDVAPGPNEFTIEVEPAAENKPTGGWGR